MSSSPNLQSSTMTKTIANCDDIRSLLYDSSDSDEIESLVFKTAATSFEKPKFKGYSLFKQESDY